MKLSSPKITLSTPHEALIDPKYLQDKFLQASPKLSSSNLQIRHVTQFTAPTQGKEAYTQISSEPTDSSWRTTTPPNRLNNG